MTTPLATRIAVVPSQRSALRLALPAVLLLLELLCASIAFDTRDLAGKGEMLRFIGDWAPMGIRFVLLFSAGVIMFGLPAWTRVAPSLFIEISESRIRWHWLLTHAVAIVLTAAIAVRCTRGGASEALNWLVLLALPLSSLAVASAVLWTISVSAISIILRALGGSSALAALLALLGTFGTNLAQSFWRPSATLTFGIVERLLLALLPRVQSDPAKLLIGSDRFHVQVAPACSGLEGVALALAFSCCWLWFFRSEYRFPNAIMLVPLTTAAMWILNSFRIAALILIGHFGAPDVAAGGFHSQAGWLAFIAVAIGLCVLSRRMPLFAAPTGAPRSLAPAAGSDAVAAYLVPFLAILAAAMISKAVSGAFEWFYALRIMAAAAALWVYRSDYRTVSWRCGPLSALGGCIVFLLWVGFDRSAPVMISPELAAMPAPARALWLAMRAIGAIITVPVAEELAFRGFLMRRLAAENFEAVSLSTFRWMPFLVSSLAFGALHGERWVEGTLAGMVYALVTIKTGRLGEAVAAHALTNALLALLVVIGGRWQYW